MIQRVARSGVMTRLDDRRDWWFIVEWIHKKIPTIGIKCGADVGMINNLPSVIRQNLESHGMANMFGNTHPTTAFLSGVRREIGV
jgi:hypothetical protein